jgi:hypothetical protein
VRAGAQRVCVCVLGPVVRGTLHGFPLAVGHDPGGLAYLDIALRAVMCRAWRRTAVGTIPRVLYVCFGPRQLAVQNKPLLCGFITFYHDHFIKILLQKLNRTEQEIVHTGSERLQRKWQWRGDIVCA